jgi:hypothetical protein
MSHHVFCDDHIVIDLSIVHRELESNEAGQDGRRASLRPDRLDPFPGRGTDDWETATREYVSCHDLAAIAVRLYALRNDMRTCSKPLSVSHGGKCWLESGDLPFHTDRPLNRLAVGLILIDFVDL